MGMGSAGGGNDGRNRPPVGGKGQPQMGGKGQRPMGGKGQPQMGGKGQPQMGGKGQPSGKGQAPGGKGQAPGGKGQSSPEMQQAYMQQMGQPGQPPMGNLQGAPLGGGMPQAPNTQQVRPEDPRMAAMRNLQRLKLGGS